MTPRESLKFSIAPIVIIGLCWYFCVEVGNTIIQKNTLFNSFLQQATWFLALVLGTTLGTFLRFIIEIIFYNIAKCYEDDKALKLTQLKLKARRKYQKIKNYKNKSLNNSINLTTNQIYKSFGCFRSIDINFLKDYIETKPMRRVGDAQYTIKYMFKDIAIIGFVSLVLYSIGTLLQIHLNLLFLLASALLTFGIAHIWIGLI